MTLYVPNTLDARVLRMLTPKISIQVFKRCRRARSVHGGPRTRSTKHLSFIPQPIANTAVCAHSRVCVCVHTQQSVCVCTSENYEHSASLGGFFLSAFSFFPVMWALIFVSSLNIWNVWRISSLCSFLTRLPLSQTREGVVVDQRATGAHASHPRLFVDKDNLASEVKDWCERVIMKCGPLPGNLWR